MVIFFTVLLIVSIVGLAALVGIKRWELSGGRVVMGAVRPRVGAMLSRSLGWVERQAPSLVRSSAHQFYLVGRSLLRRALAWAMIHAERLLERTLHTIRQGTDTPRGEGEASAFLREVAEHKKSLLNRSGKQENAIYEE